MPKRSTGEPKPLSIPPDLAARCDQPGRAERMDRLFRSVFIVPHSSVLKDAAKRKRDRAKRKP